MATQTKAAAANRLAIVYDPDREQVRPLLGVRTVRGFVVAWFADQNSVEHYRFEPGVNWIGGDLWERLQQLAAVQQRLRNGALRPMVPREVGETENTTRYGEEDAKILVDNTYDLTRLDNWLRTERRPGILTYVQNRIEAIRSGRI